jgi:hypothetical protein
VEDLDLIPHLLVEKMVLLLLAVVAAQEELTPYLLVPVVLVS